MAIIQNVPEFSHSRERRIELEEKPVIPGVSAKPEVTNEMVGALYDDIAKVIGKADKLLAEIDRISPKFIPVHKNALEVRLAIRSLWPGAQEDLLTYDQYTESLDAEYALYNFDPKKTIDLLTGDTFVDSRVMDQTMQESALRSIETYTMVGQFALLLLCNRMLQTFQAPNIQASVSAKMPPGTEAAATIAQVLIGIAAILAQTLITEQEITKALDQTFGEFVTASGLSSADIVASAKETQPDAFMRDYTLSRADEHRANVRDYARNHAANNVGYETWMIAEDAREIKEDLKASYREANNYGRALYTMGKDIYTITKCGLDRSNDRLNKIAAVLGHKYTRDMLCCFARFITTIPVDMLNPLRTGLALAAKGISVDLGASLNSLTSGLNAKLERMFLEPLLHMISTFFKEQKERVLAIMDPASYSSPEDFNTLLLCTPIDDMFTYVFSALDKLQSFIIKYIRRYWEFGQLKHKAGSYKVQILADSRRAAMLLKLVDAIMSSINAGNLCAQEDSRTPSPEDIDDIMRRTELDLPSTINIETGDDPYTTFTTDDIKDFTTAQGLPIIQEPTEDTDGAHSLQDCARARISDKNMAEFIARIQKLSEDLANATTE